MHNVTRNRDFAGVPDHRLDQGIFKGCFIIVTINNNGGIGPERNMNCLSALVKYIIVGNYLKPNFRELLLFLFLI